MTIARRYLIIIIALISVISVGGVYATWMYAEEHPMPKETSVGVSIEVFDYPPEQMLPGGGENTGEVQLGQNHFMVIDLIVNKAKNGYHLNNSGSVLHDFLDERGVVYSNQKTGGGNMKFVIDPKYNTHKVYFVLVKDTDSLYYAYTFDTDALATAGGSNLEISVYKTKIEKIDGVWDATVTHIGQAQTVSLRDMGYDAMSQTIGYTIRYDTWHL